MFDRCDEDATVIVKTAADEARGLGHTYLGTEHLLVALSRHRQLLPAPVAELLPPADDLRARVVAEIDTPARRDAELLRAVGIDLDAVRTAVRRTFGDDAVDALGRRSVHQPWQPWRRPSRRCTALLSGSIGIAPRVKQAFELARLHAASHARAIDPAALLLGMIDVEDAISNRLLVQSGVDPATLRQRLVS